MQKVNRFTRFWDMIGNSGRFPNTLPIILGDDPFQRFFQISNGLYLSAEGTWKISLKRLYNLLYEQLTEILSVEPAIARKVLEQDYSRSGQKGQPSFIKPQLKSITRSGVANKRQRNHL